MPDIPPVTAGSRIQTAAGPAEVRDFLVHPAFAKDFADYRAAQGRVAAIFGKALSR